MTHCLHKLRLEWECRECKRDGLKASDQYETPPELFDPLMRRYKFTADLAASRFNHRLPFYFSAENNALAQDWSAYWHEKDGDGWHWCNPPYSRGNLRFFTERALLMVARGWAGVFLIPATLDAGWFQDNILRGHNVLEGGSTNPADGPSLMGWKLRLGGSGYQITVTILRRRVPFLLDGVKVEGAKTGSCLVEYRPRRLL